MNVCVCVCVCVCVWTEWTWSMQYIGIPTYQFIPHYASAIHKHTRILKPFEDSELTGLKVDTAQHHVETHTLMAELLKTYTDERA